MDTWIIRRDQLQRQFTVMSNNDVEALTLSVNDLSRMKKEFMNCYNELFNNVNSTLKRSMRMKLRAIKSCRKQQRKFDKEGKNPDEQVLEF